jgi:hypothetical protein
MTMAGQNSPSWRDAVERIAAADVYWLATTRPDGRPHLVPVLGVVVDGVLHFAAGPSTVKARNILRDPRCVVSARHDERDLVVDGVAARVVDDALLRQVAEECLAKYAWPVTVADGAFIGEGAPTAGPPPYEVYRLVPALVFGLPTDETFAPARWVFRAGGGHPPCTAPSPISTTGRAARPASSARSPGRRR